MLLKDPFASSIEKMVQKIFLIKKIDMLKAIKVTR